MPDFQQAANLMASVIYCKEKKFNSEISRIFSTSGGFLNPDESSTTGKAGGLAVAGPSKGPDRNRLKTKTSAPRDSGETNFSWFRIVRSCLGTIGL